MTVKAIFGTPSQMRVLDSRSYLRMTSSASIAAPSGEAARSSASVLVFPFFLNSAMGSSFSSLAETMWVSKSLR